MLKLLDQVAYACASRCAASYVVTVARHVNSCFFTMVAVDEQGRKVAVAPLQPAPDTLEQWLILHRQKVPDGSATARAIDYSLRRWQTLVRYLDDGDLPIDNNRVKNRIRPIGRRIRQAHRQFAATLLDCGRCDTLIDYQITGSRPRQDDFPARVRRGNRYCLAATEHWACCR